MQGVTTKTDVETDEWLIGDEVIRVREWGGERKFILPLPPYEEVIIGAGEGCSFRLDDRRVSREHARLIREQEKWWLYDAGSKNGVRADGVQSDKFLLAPGLEIGIGGVTLLAESGRWIALRGFLSRILGWTTDRTKVVDRALRAIRMAASRRNALVLCGEADLVLLAQSLHRHTLGIGRPFVSCDPFRRDGAGSARSSANHRAGMAAFSAATGGSLCMWASRLPRDFPEVRAQLREPDARVQLIVCSHRREECEPFVAVPIQVPSLTERTMELGRIVEEYARDAITELAVPPTSFIRADRAWVLQHAVTSLPEIEKATLRLVALRASCTVTQAAERLGIAPISLSRWIERRKLPMEVEP
jgi:FHA domain-containing protein